MTTVKLYCTGATARATVDGPLTHGMVGVQAEIQWDGAWDGLMKTLKVRCAEVCRTAVVSEDGTAVIPCECLIAGQWLVIGMDGWDKEGNLRIPSSWASCGVVKPSVAQCDGPEGAPPTVDTVAQLQILVGRAESAAGELSGAAAAAASSASDADKSAKAAQEALNKTTEIAVSTPYIGANGNWIVWDAEKASYVDSGVRAVGNDANVTADNINKALGFTPADENAVNQIKNDISVHEPWYPGVDLTAKFADEIAGYSDPGAWIRARIRANNFDGIHVNDYIPFTTTHGLSFKARVAGIDPYYEYGDSVVGHHIDFICEELWPTFKPINPVNYNNGLIPTENVTSDGSSTQYVLTKPMYGVENVSQGGVYLTGWTYDKDTYTLTFSAAPAAGTMAVTGTGSKHPWLASDAYLYVNSLVGHVANSAGLNPAIKRVDYTNDGIYHYLPDWLQAVIIEKRFLLNERYSTSGVLSDENSWSWANLGKLWFPTEVEVYGCPVWGSKGGYGLGGSIQYPLFMGNIRRLKKWKGKRAYWWLLSPNTNTTNWCYVNSYGTADNSISSADYRAVPVCFRIG